MEILFVSDYVCPYCLVAKEALRLALERSGLEASIKWHPFELTPAGRPQVDTFHDEVRKAHYQVLVEPCRKMGLDMKLPPAVVPRPRTHMAFQGYYYACAHGVGERYNDLLYRAYFAEELDIGDLKVLSALAQRAGMDGKAFAAAIASGAYSEQVEDSSRFAREELKITGVPTIYIDGRKITLETFMPEEMLRLILDGAAASTGSFGCGADGC